eukprot:TRINITY_DN45275_c0_g1_i1.p1 TRINITY_DN45275_c0_g1~~TRINITY_DN45275_c0_g1_i1.p1  ORF type:complete len:190 (-),score=28.38 TRINITY_DN45275_c0_g1_i1:126-695(-)
MSVEMLTVPLEPGLLTLHPDSVVCSTQNDKIKGLVTIGSGTVVHPSCTILAEAGPIEIGANNILEEQVVIRNSGFPGGMTIGAENLFQVGCCIEAERVGDACCFGVKATVRAGATLDSGCDIGAATELTAEDVVEYETAVWAPHNQRTPIPGSVEAHMTVITEQRKILKKQLVSFHKMMGKTAEKAPGR